MRGKKEGKKEKKERKKEKKDRKGKKEKENKKETTKIKKKNERKNDKGDPRTSFVGLINSHLKIRCLDIKLSTDVNVSSTSTHRTTSNKAS